MRQQESLQLPTTITLWDEIKRIQQRSKHVLTVALECLQGYNSDPQQQQYLNSILSELMRIMMTIERDMELKLQETSSHTTPTTSNSGSTPISTSTTTSTAPTTATTTSSSTTILSGVVLVQQYYSPTDSIKSSDINLALWRNLQNPYITDIYLLNEVEVSYKGFPNTHNLHQVVVGERLTFKQTFEFANQYLQNRTVIIGKI